MIQVSHINVLHLPRLSGFNSLGLVETSLTPSLKTCNFLNKATGEATPWSSFILTPYTWTHKHQLRPALKDLQLTFSSFIPASSCIGTREHRTANPPPPLSPSKKKTYKCHLGYQTKNKEKGQWTWSSPNQWPRIRTNVLFNSLSISSRQRSTYQLLGV